MVTQQGQNAPAAKLKMTQKNNKAGLNHDIIPPNVDKELKVYLGGKSFAQLRFPKLQAIYVQILQDYLDKKISPGVLSVLSDEFFAQAYKRNKLRTTLGDVLFITIEVHFLNESRPQDIPAINQDLKEYLQILRAELPFPGKNQKKARQLP